LTGSAKPGAWLATTMNIDRRKVRIAHLALKWEDGRHNSEHTNLPGQGK
jgi:hypothetical protein